MSQPRPFQAAACFLIELGNGDKFLFDIGDGSVERLFTLQIPFDYLDKVFISHLHPIYEEVSKALGREFGYPPK